MEELIEEHRTGRKTVKALLAAKERYKIGEKKAVLDIIRHLKTLIEFYPKHIEKEDRHFFLPCMEYFSNKEKKEMLEESFQFDRRMIHEHYEKVLDELSK